MPNRHVVPSGKNWAVKAPNNSTPLSTHRTQSAAEKAAKDSLSGVGGQVYIHRPNGEIRDADTVAPANDPSNVRDTKH
jgi:hypothetical protein